MKALKAIELPLVLPVLLHLFLELLKHAPAWIVEIFQLGGVRHRMSVLATQVSHLLLLHLLLLLQLWRLLLAEA